MAVIAASVVCGIEVLFLALEYGLCWGIMGLACLSGL